MPTFSPAPPADDAAAPRRGTPQNYRADLAGWTSGELPGQASAGLAAWPSPDRQPGEGVDRGPAPLGPVVPSAREPGSRQPEASAGTPDPTAWLRLA
jgi:hypothetical protein